MTVGLLFLAGSTVLGIWAFACYRRRLALPRPYWMALRVTAALLAVQVILGLTFVGAHMLPQDRLHFMYAGLVTLGVAAQELLRPTASLGRMLREEGGFNEAGTYALITIVVALLTLRLWMTGIGM